MQKAEIMNEEMIRFIDEMNYLEGDGVILNNDRKKTIPNPILIVGYGGTGCQTVRVIKRRLNREYEHEDGEQIPHNIAILGIDTAANELKAESGYRDMKLSPSETYVLSEECGDIADKIYKGQMDENDADWYDLRLNETTGHDIQTGAGGKRQWGRAPLIQCATDLSDVLDALLTRIATGTPEKIYVFIVTGTGGGTGSGCFLDVSYMIRQACAKVENPCMINGYIVMPDVSERIPEVAANSKMKAYVQRNGYAALKELDFWMGAGKRGDRYYARHGGKIISANDDAALFDNCWLMTAIDSKKTLIANPETAIQEKIFGNMELWLSKTETINAKDGKVKSAHESFDSNRRQSIEELEEDLKKINRHYPVGYRYSASGASEWVFPRIEINTYLASKLFLEVRELHNKSIMAEIRDDVNNIISTLNLQKENVEEDIDFKLREIRDLEIFKGDPKLELLEFVKDSYGKPSDPLTDKMHNISDKHSEAIEKCVKDVVSRYKSTMKDDVIEKYFTDENKGPFYLRRILQDGDLGLASKFKEKARAIQMDIDALNKQIKMIEEKAVEAREKYYETVGKGKSKYKTFDAYLIRQYNLETKKAGLIGVMDVYNNLYEWTRIQAMGTYTFVEDMLNALSNVFSTNNDQIKAVAKHKEEKDAVVFSFNVISTGEIVSRVNTWVENNEAGANMLGNFLNDLFDNLESKKLLDLSIDRYKELRSSNYDIKSFISDHIHKQFGDLVSKTLQDYIKEKAEASGDEKKYFKEKFEKILLGASPMFNVNSTLAGDTTSVSVISFPEGMPYLSDRWEEYKENSDRKFDPAKWTEVISSEQNKISASEVYVGLPMCSWNSIGTYETAYHNKVFANELGELGIGVHLVRNEDGEDWKELPSPMATALLPQDKIASRAYITSREQKSKELFDTAYTEGAIHRNGSDLLQYVELITTMPLKASDIAQLEKDEDKKLSLLEFARDLIIGKEKSIPSNKFGNLAIGLKHHKIEKSAALAQDDPTGTKFNLDLAKSYFERDYYGNKRVSTILTLLRDILNEINEIKKRDQNVDLFVKALINGQIANVRRIVVLQDNDMEYELLERTPDIKEYSTFYYYKGFIRFIENTRMNRGGDKIVDNLINTINTTFNKNASELDLEVLREKLDTVNEMVNYKKQMNYLITKGKQEQKDKMQNVYERVNAFMENEYDNIA